MDGISCETPGASFYTTSSGSGKTTQMRRRIPIATVPRPVRSQEELDWISRHAGLVDMEWAHLVTHPELLQVAAKSTSPEYQSSADIASVASAKISSSDLTSLLNLTSLKVVSDVDRIIENDGQARQLMADLRTLAPALSRKLFQGWLGLLRKQSVPRS